MGGVLLQPHPRRWSCWPGSATSPGSPRRASWRPGPGSPRPSATPLLRRPYDLCHSGVTWRLNSGVPPTEVAAWTGAQRRGADARLRQVHDRAGRRVDQPHGRHPPPRGCRARPRPAGWWGRRPAIVSAQDSRPASAAWAAYRLQNLSEDGSRRPLSEPVRRLIHIMPAQQPFPAGSDGRPQQDSNLRSRLRRALIARTMTSSARTSLTAGRRGKPCLLPRRRARPVALDRGETIVRRYPFIWRKPDHRPFH